MPSVQVPMDVSLHVDSLGGWLGLTALTLVLIQALFFLATSPRHLLARYVVLFIIGGMFMVGGYSAYVNTSDPVETRFWTVVCYLGVASMPPSLHGLVAMLTCNTRRQRQIIRLMSCLALFWMVMILIDNGQMVTDRLKENYRHPSMEKGPLFKVFFMVTYVQFTASYIELLIRLWRGRRAPHIVLPALGFTAWVFNGFYDFSVAANWISPPALLWPGPVILAVALGMYLGLEARRTHQVAESNLLQYKTLFDNALEGIFRLDAKGTIDSINPALVRLLGYTSPDVLLGKSITMLFANRDDYLELQTHIDTCEQIKGLETNLITAHGQATPVTISVTRIKNGEEGAKAYEGTVFDLRDYKAKALAEQERESAQRLAQMRSEFLASMSHEIRTPISAISGFTELCLDTELDVAQRDYLSKVSLSTNALLGIINDILDLSKIEAGQLTLEDTPFNLRAVVDDVIDMLGQKSTAKGLRLIGWISKDMPSTLIGDPLRLQQIMINLCNNAIKFTRTGHVCLAVRCVANAGGATDIVLSVADTGIGIDPGKIKGLFDAYSQADKSTSREYGGTGLGLNITKRLVEAMGGTIDATSLPGVGTTFSCRLTLLCPEQDVIRPQTAAAALTVFVVTEDVDFAMAISLYAELSGATYLGKMSCDEFLGDLTVPPCSWVVTDETEVTSVLVQREVSVIGWHPPISGLICIPERYISASWPISFRCWQFVLDVHLFNQRKPLATDADKHKTITPDLRGKRILVVDDVPFNRDLILKMLEKTGAELEIAEQGAQALEMAMTRNYDLVLMDCEMPVMNGYDATRAIREKVSASLPIVAMTANAMPEDQQKCLSAGMSDYITKPYKRPAVYLLLLRWLAPDQVDTQ